MSAFVPYEIEVLKLLASPAVPSEIVEVFAHEAKLVSCEFSESGYFLTVTHPRLPKEKSTQCEPIVMGHADGIDCGFVLFFGQHEMTVECHSWGSSNVPKDFRSRDVRIEIRNDVLR